MEKLKKEFEYVYYVVRSVLSELKTPLSVSFLNTEFASKSKPERNSGITLKFMKIFKDEFKFNVIGADIKVQLKDEREQSFNEEYDAIVGKVKKIFLKDSIKLNDVKRKMLVEKSMVFDQFCRDFSSNKYSINLPSINRNSHKLKLKAVDRQTYVEFSEDDNIFIDEVKFWEIIETQGFEELVLKILINLTSKFYKDLDQGQLQVCFKYDIALDRSFMTRHERYFERKDQTKFKLKEEYRETSESLVTATSTTATVASRENKIIVTCAGNLENLSCEMKEQDTIGEISAAVGNHVTEIQTRETEIRSSNIKNSDTETDDDVVSDTNFTSDEPNTDSESEEETQADQISKEAQEELEEKNKKQWSNKETVRNEKLSESANATMNLCNPWTRKGEGEVKKSEMDITDGSRNSGSIRKDSKKKTETYKLVKNAIKSGRSVIVPGKSDKEPLAIGFSKSPEKKRHQLGDIGVFILKEMQK